MLPAVLGSLVGPLALALALAASAPAPTAAQAQAQWILRDEYTEANFFDEFDFFDLPDPTHGFVEYTSAFTASTERLAGYWNRGIFLGLDYSTHRPSMGRKSTRVSSRSTYSDGLFIADIAHMPGSICGVWPAMWSTSEADWPFLGEIDIIEGVNNQDRNSITLHTGPGCSITNDGTTASTQLKEADCNANTAFTGCGQETGDNQNYGDGFNAIGGGVWAWEWDDDAISVWFFPRPSIPADVRQSRPDPSTWGSPTAKFNGGDGCSIRDHFRDHKIIFDTTFCGDWAGSVWGSNPECSSLAPTCEEYVAGNPAAFAQAYWLINYIQVYKTS